MQLNLTNRCQSSRSERERRGRVCSEPVCLCVCVIFMSSVGPVLAGVLV